MMPLKPFAMKLPFNQKLELELIGRVVPDPEAAVGSPSSRRMNSPHRDGELVRQSAAE